MGIYNINICIEGPKAKNTSRHLEATIQVQLAAEELKSKEPAQAQPSSRTVIFGAHHLEDDEKIRETFERSSHL